MTENVIVAIVSAIPSIIVAAVSIISNNRVISYKIDALEKKQEKFNNLIERTFVLERDVKTAFNEMGDIKSDIGRLEDRLMKS